MKNEIWFFSIVNVEHVLFDVDNVP